MYSTLQVNNIPRELEKIFKKENLALVCRSFLVARWVKDLALSLLWCVFDPRLWNCGTPWAWPKKELLVMALWLGRRVPFLRRDADGPV